jgi:ribosomal protein RSM22 (predicted rRNA methylase)
MLAIARRLLVAQEGWLHEGAPSSDGPRLSRLLPPPAHAVMGAHGDAHSGAHDLVIASFALGDLPSADARANLVRALWQQTRDVLVLIDRGNPEGFQRIAQARAQLLEAEPAHALHVVAPCSHDGACPMRGAKSWCHFSQRFQKDKGMMLFQGSKSNLEDVKFAYVVVRRGPRPGRHEPGVPETAADLSAEAYHWPRIIAPPLKRAGHVLLDQCAPSGIIERMVVRKADGGLVYTAARKAAWGDLWPYPEQGRSGPSNMAAPRRAARSLTTSEGMDSVESEDMVGEEEHVTPFSSQ